MVGGAAVGVVVVIVISRIVASVGVKESVIRLVIMTAVRVGAVVHVGIVKRIGKQQVFFASVVMMMVVVVAAVSMLGGQQKTAAVICERIALTTAAAVVMQTAIVIGRVVFDVLHRHLIRVVQLGIVVRTTVMRVVLTVHVFVAVRLCAGHGRGHLTAGTAAVVDAVLPLVMLVAVVGVQNMGQDTVS